MTGHNPSLLLLLAHKPIILPPYEKPVACRRPALLGCFHFAHPARGQTNPNATDPNTTAEVPQDNKLVIYQLLPRLFGNKVALNKPYGTMTENGCGKFNDITDKALDEIKKLGVTHVWYTGVIEHATMTDYPPAFPPTMPTW